MYSREEIEERVERYKPNTMSIPCAKHISDMLEDIQEHMINKKPVGKFAELCSNEDWVYAE